MSEPSPVVRVARRIAKLLRLVLGEKRRPPLPDGASLDPAFAETIAADAVKLNAARLYWRQQLLTWGQLMDFFAGPAGRLADRAAVTPSSVVSSARNNLRRRNEYDLNGGANLVKSELAPLLSLTEIAKHVAETMPNPIATTSADVLRQDVSALLNGTPAQPAADVASVARGIRCARELVDVGKRLGFARTHYQSHLAAIPGASFAELLSLHWNEGGFAVAPSWRSYQAGPLILALPRTATVGTDLERYGYRIANVFLGSTGVTRPGYITCHPWKSGWTTAANANGDLVNANVMTLGGLDNMLVWKARSAGNDSDHTKDELWRLLTAYYTQRGMGAFNSRPVYGFCLGELEAATGVPGTRLLDDAMARIVTIYTATTDAIPTGASSPTHAVLKVDDDAKETANALAVAARWYASRRAVRTLVAWRDRGDSLLADEYLSPYLAYLRYHQGDVFFMRSLLSALRGLPVLEQKWETLLRNATRRQAFDAAGANLLTHMAASGWADAGDRETLKVLAGSWLAAWGAGTVRYLPPESETAWRNVGLIAVMRAAAPSDPVLTAVGAVPADAPLSAVADVAFEFAQAMSSYGMWPVLDCALQYSPVQALLDARVHSATTGAGQRSRTGFVAQLSKAENFERRRLYYEHVRGLAGLAADAT